MRVPAFLLRRLYVKGSLKPTIEGFQFQLRNRLGSGYARRLLPLTLDGEALDMAKTTFEIEGRVLGFEAVDREVPFTLGMNRETSMVVKGRTLTPGPHRVGLGFSVVGLGMITFEIADEVQS